MAEEDRPHQLPFVRSYSARAAAMSASVSVTGIGGAGRWLCTSPTMRAGLAERPHRLDATAMCEQGVMIGLVQVAALTCRPGAK